MSWTLFDSFPFVQNHLAPRSGGARESKNRPLAGTIFANFLSNQVQLVFPLPAILKHHERRRDYRFQDFNRPARPCGPRCVSPFPPSTAFIRQPFAELRAALGEFPPAFAELRHPAGEFPAPFGEFPESSAKLPEPFGEFPQCFGELPQCFGELPKWFAEPGLWVVFGSSLSVKPVPYQQPANKNCNLNQNFNL